MVMNKPISAMNEFAQKLAEFKENNPYREDFCILEALHHVTMASWILDPIDETSGLRECLTAVEAELARRCYRRGL